MPFEFGPFVSMLGLVERKVVKGERKCHCRAGSKPDSKLGRIRQLESGRMRSCRQSNCARVREFVFFG